MPDYQRLLNKLVAKTAAGRVPWRATMESDLFAASIDGEFTVTIGRTALHEFVFEMRDKQENKLVQLSAEKTQAWEQGYEEAVENFELLRHLFEAARAAALDVSNQLARAEALLDNS